MVTILDGGVGQELLRRSGAAPDGLWATGLMLKHPEILREVHESFFAAGAEIATANTYAIHRDRLQRAGIEDRLAELQHMAIQIACAARDAHGSGRVAGAIGPLGWSYRPDMMPPAETAVPLFAEIAALQAPHVDLLLVETMASVHEVRCALDATLPLGKPVWLAVTVLDDDGTRLRSGEALSDVLPVLADRAPQAILVNCAPPEVVDDALRVLVRAGLPLGAYANGFVRVEPSYLDVFASVDGLSTRQDLSPQRYADHAAAWAARGATILGGCCEVGPAHIAELVRSLNTQAA
ncbi:MAG: homocysteine S-methyltransferase family protein [Pseudomonadota bacterium]